MFPVLPAPAGKENMEPSLRAYHDRLLKIIEVDPSKVPMAKMLITAVITLDMSLDYKLPAA